jgi:hypothetical protein
VGDPGGVFKGFPLPGDAVVHVEVSQRTWGLEREGLLAFTTALPVEDVQRLLDDELPRLGWSYGDHRDRDKPSWEDWRPTGCYRRDDGRERLVVKIQKDEEARPRMGITITFGDEEKEKEEEKEKPALPRTVRVWYLRSLPAERVAKDWREALRQREGNATAQYELARRLLEDDPETALEVGRRLAAAEPKDEMFHLLAAEACDRLGPARRADAARHYRQALVLLKDTGELKLEKQIREKLVWTEEGK